MKLDWQTIAVSLIILAACCYVARRGYARLRSFRHNGNDGAAGCETGCGSCGNNTSQTTSQPATLVRISPLRTSPRQTSRRPS